MIPRIPPALEAQALMRQVQGEGGFATVLAKGEPEAGTLLVVLTHNGADTRAYERLPMADGTRAWHCARRDDPEKPGDFGDYLARRVRQDSDLWIIELDIAGGERFIGLPPAPG